MRYETAEPSLHVPNPNENRKKPLFRFIDLFAGIGGFRQAFEAIGGQCVFTCERDKHCTTTYRANYTIEHPISHDIRHITYDRESLAQIPKHDVLLAGFPCQPFSIAGVSKKNALGQSHGFGCATQGTLFFDLVQVMQFHRPPVFLLENVKNLISHDKGNTFRVIRHTLEQELGYHFQYKVIDGQYWVPQHRQRIFIAGFRYDSGFSFDNLKLPSSRGPTLSSILHKEDGTEADEPPYLVNSKVGQKYTLSPGLWSFLQNYKEKHRLKGNGFGYSLIGPDDVARTLSARYYKDGSEILIQQKRRRPRRLTPRECARLMGFDRPGKPKFKIPVSDSQAYRQFGNAVIVPVVEVIARLMKPHILFAVRKEHDNH